MRHFLFAGTTLLLCHTAVLAADAEMRGTLARLDLPGKSVTIESEGGKKATFALVGPTRVLDAKGVEAKEGLKDKRLAEGVQVRLVLTVTGRTVREIHLSNAAPVEAKVVAVKKDVPKAEAKGLAAKVLRVDAESRTAQVQWESGEKAELKLGADVKFLGPKGGASAKGIKDDRFVPGAEVRIVMDGQTVREIQLPYRK